ncbi:MAG: hypothetical protein IPQ08_13640 [Chitinophagaceae bacterium]|nr:hypothetical protein [Chitinophagaceae bacterium]
MSKIRLLLLTIYFLTFLTLPKAQTPNQLKSLFADKTLYKTDTVIKNVLIDGTKFSIKVLRDRFDEHLDKFTEEDEPSFTQAPITVVFTRPTDDNPIYIKRFDFEPNDYPYLNYSFYKGQEQNLSNPGKLYLLLNKGYGGSGSTSSRYFIDFKDREINLNPLFTSSGELSYIVYNRNDNEIIALDGIWNMDENESHFANHKYIITRYVNSKGSFDKEEIGQTKFKHSSLDENKTISQILSDIKVKEPSLLTRINLSDYDILSGKKDITDITDKNSNASNSQIFYLGDDLIPDTKNFKLIGISSQTNVHSYQYIGEYKNKYYYGRQIGDIIVGIKNGKIVTTIYNVIPEKTMSEFQVMLLN